MKTKACFYIRKYCLGEIRAVAKDGYIERVGERLYCYDKRGGYWYITDYRTGLFISCFPRLKDCQEHLQKVSVILEKRLKLAEEETDDVKFTRSVIALMRKEAPIK